MQSIISRQGKGSKRESGAALMCCTKVNSSEHGRKCGVEDASVFQPVRQLQMMSWLLGDPLLPGCLLPPPCPCRSMPPCRDHGRVWAWPHSAQLCHSVCGVTQGRGAAAPAALQFQRWLMQHEKEKWCLYRLRNLPQEQGFLLLEM